MDRVMDGMMMHRPVMPVAHRMMGRTVNGVMHLRTRETA